MFADKEEQTRIIRHKHKQIDSIYGSNIQPTIYGKN